MTLLGDAYRELGFRVEEPPLSDDEKRRALYNAMNKKPRIDNLGITIKVSELKTYPIKCYFQSQIDGTGFFSRIWCMFIRPMFFPERQKRLYGLLDTSNVLLQQEYTNKIFSEAEDLLDEQTNKPT